MDILSLNSLAILWFALTGLLLIGEVMSNTLYLLAISMGTLAAGALAYGGSPLTYQLSAAIFVASISTVIIWLNRRHQTARQTNQDDPDIGQQVEVIQLVPLLVHYRGADWQASFQHPPMPEPSVGAHYFIHQKQANQLILTPISQLDHVAGGL